MERRIRKIQKRIREIKSGYGEEDKEATAGYKRKTEWVCR